MKRPVKKHEVSQPLDKPYRLIPLTQGQNAIVDAKDFEWLSQWNWHANRGQGSFYAIRRTTKEEGDWRGPGIRMHRVILGCKPSEEGDHKNGNGLDNRRENLRVCIDVQNGYNRKVGKNNSIGYKGVRFCKNHKTRPWRAVTEFKDRSIHIGYFATREEAARAYDKKVKELHGEFANLNFHD